MIVRFNLLLSVTSLLAIADAQAQSAVAAINGTAEHGNTVRIENIETGYSREIEVAKRGRFQFRSLPTGTYDVIIREPDGDIVKSQLVTLRVGGTASVRQGPRDESAGGAEQQSGSGGDGHGERAPEGDAQGADQRLRAARDAGERAEPGEKNQ